MDKKYLNCLVVANIYLHKEWLPSVVTPYKLGENSVSYYWETGPSRCMSRLSSFEVLYVFGSEFQDQDGYWDWDKIDLWFVQKYYPIEPNIEPDENGSYLGWISPEGDYYKASYGNHDTTARSIMIKVYDQPMRGVDAREQLLGDLGWLQVLGDVALLGRTNFDTWEETITEAQLTTVREIGSRLGHDKETRLLHSVERRKVV